LSSMISGLRDVEVRGALAEDIEAMLRNRQGH
jgi:hypothetical protein